MPSVIRGIRPYAPGYQLERRGVEGSVHPGWPNECSLAMLNAANMAMYRFCSAAIMIVFVHSSRTCVYIYLGFTSMSKGDATCSDGYPGRDCSFHVCHRLLRLDHGLASVVFGILNECSQQTYLDRVYNENLNDD